MCRSIWKLPFVKYYFLSNKFNNPKTYLYSTKNRSSTIVYNFVKKKIRLYTGREFISTVRIHKSMVGCKLGEFSFSKVRGNAITESLILKGKLKRKGRGKQKQSVKSKSKK